MTTQTVPADAAVSTFIDVDGTQYTVYKWPGEEANIVYKQYIGNDGTQLTVRVSYGSERLLDIAERIIKHYYME